MIVEGYRQKGQPIQLEELKSFLWGAATRLRGQIDAAGYKEYIFPLLFFKRISDVYDEQYAGFLHDGGEEYANMLLDFYSPYFYTLFPFHNLILLFC